MFQHTAARRRLPNLETSFIKYAGVSTHSRPKAAAKALMIRLIVQMFQHTAARRRLLVQQYLIQFLPEFQHTAARRRLPRANAIDPSSFTVSTHSRPKAAALSLATTYSYKPFQHTAARRRLQKITLLLCLVIKFQHTAARRRLH